MTAPRSTSRRFMPLTCSLALAGCGGNQSALAPGGVEADRVATLSWMLFAGGGVIFVAVIAITALALLGRPAWKSRLSREALILGGGIAFPVIVLTALLAYGLLVLRAGGTSPADDALRISVIGEQWWWRVVYASDDGATFETANEIRVPTGRTIELSLTTADVIHSFWVPRLAGKLDMIPGRTNVLRFTADRPGVSRGQCAEYCGGAHALMAFNVVAMEPAAFDRWFEHERADAAPPTGAERQQGQLTFLSGGCAGCHAVRGTPANGTLGPDLTHLAGRLTLAAGTLPNSREAIAEWIVNNQHIKPENQMPPFGIFNEGELDALSAYLAGLD